MGYAEIRTIVLPVCSDCRERVSTCARCGRPLFAGEEVRCDPDEGKPRHTHEEHCEPCKHLNCEAGTRRCLDCGVHVPYDAAGPSVDTPASREGGR